MSTTLKLLVHFGSLTTGLTLHNCQNFIPRVRVRSPASNAGLLSPSPLATALQYPTNGYRMLISACRACSLHQHPRERERARACFGPPHATVNHAWDFQHFPCSHAPSRSSVLCPSPRAQTRCTASTKWPPLAPSPSYWNRLWLQTAHEKCTHIAMLSETGEGEREKTHSFAQTHHAYRPRAAPHICASETCQRVPVRFEPETTRPHVCVCVVCFAEGMCG